MSVIGARFVASRRVSLDFSYVMGRRLQRMIVPHGCCVHEIVLMLPDCTMLMFAMSMWESLVVGSYMGTFQWALPT